MKGLSNIILLFLFQSFCRGEIRVSLNSNGFDGTWIVWNQNESIQTTARVPGGIYSDLQEARIFDENLFYRFNDMDYRWVSRDNWTYQTVFDLDRKVLQKRAIGLVFHGVDTVGDIYLNGKLLTSVDNMFVRYVLPVKGLIKEKNNTLQIRLKSPIHVARRLAELQKRFYPVPPECTPDSYNGECHVNFLRKMQASFSWDWGPAFPSVGIWKPVEIEAYDLAVIRDVTLGRPIRVNSTTWKVSASYFVEYPGTSVPEYYTSERLWTTDLDRNEVAVNAVIERVKTKDSFVSNGFIHHVVFYLNRSNIQLWWPNGFGNSVLYNLTVRIASQDGSEISEKTVRIGFREIELVEEELQPGKPGLTFYFKVNGVPIFAKGSNWIPGHILPEHGQNESILRDALTSAKDANMNMLRVWGGGVYESDTFYEIADELGILIWQDMMFACSMYPVNEEFLESVKMETFQNVRRLQHHPSIAIWAGNNENEAALRGNWYGTHKNYSQYKEDYIKLYVDTIRPVVLENDDTRAYVTSSPSNGVKSAEDGYIANDPYSPLYGDVHYYNYIFDGWNDYVYPDTRFASEYGFQSMPSYGSMSKVSLLADRRLTSEFTKKRQHLPGGNQFLINLIEHQFSLPADDNSEEFYKRLIYYSQIIQAMSTKTETEKYRRDRIKLTADNKGHTMGAMYWQLNDVWQAPSWSSIEFGGKWKMLHYFAKKFFSPVLISPEKSPRDQLNVFLVSDLLKDIPNVYLNISIYSWDSIIPRKTYSLRVLLRKNTVEMHVTDSLSQLLRDSNCDNYNCFVYMSVEGPDVYSDNFVLPCKMKEVRNLKRPDLKAEVVERSTKDEVLVRVTTNNIAPFVWLETEESGEFSDNGFLLLKEEITVAFRSRNNSPVDVEKLWETQNM